MSTIRSACPAIIANLRNAAGVAVARPNIPIQMEEVEGSDWLYAIMVPSGTAGNIDHVNGTSSGWASITVDKNGVTPILGGKVFILTGKIKAGATTDLVNNLITVSINSVEVGRIYVDADNQRIGWMAYSLPGDREDARFALSGTSTTGDLIFAASAADPALELHLLILGND